MKTLKVTDQNLVFEIIEDRDALRQRVDHRLRMQLGSWFLDEDAGFPVMEILGQKKPDLNFILLLIRSALLTDPEVISVDELYMNFENRSLNVNFTVTTIYGVI